MDEFITTPENCYLGFGYIPDERLQCPGGRRNILAAYLGFPSSSNLLAKAALFAKPIVVAGYCVGKAWPATGSGLPCPRATHELVPMRWRVTPGAATRTLRRICRNQFAC